MLRIKWTNILNVLCVSIYEEPHSRPYIIELWLEANKNSSFYLLFFRVRCSLTQSFSLSLSLPHSFSLSRLSFFLAFQHPSTRAVMTTAAKSNRFLRVNFNQIEIAHTKPSNPIKSEFMLFWWVFGLRSIAKYFKNAELKHMTSLNFWLSRITDTISFKRFIQFNGLCSCILCVILSLCFFFVSLVCLCLCIHMFFQTHQNYSTSKPKSLGQWYFGDQFFLLVHFVSSSLLSN